MNNSSPIANSYIVQRSTNTPSDRLYIAEDVHVSQSRVAPVISSSTSQSGGQKATNHNTNSTFQTLVVPNEHPTNSRTAVQNTTTPKTVQSSRATTTVAKNSQAVGQFDVQKCGHKETHLVEIANDNGTSVVPSHNHAAFPSNVPNHVSILKVGCICC